MRLVVSKHQIMSENDIVVGLSSLPIDILVLISNELNQHDFSSLCKNNKRFNTDLWKKRTSFILSRPHGSTDALVHESVVAAQQAQKLDQVRTILIESSLIKNAAPFIKCFSNLTEVHIRPWITGHFQEDEYISAFQAFTSLKILTIFYQEEHENPIKLGPKFFSQLPATLEELCVTLTPDQVGPLHHLPRLDKLLLLGTQAVEKLFNCPRLYFSFTAMEDIPIESWTNCMKELDEYLPRHLSAKAIFGVTNMYLNMGVDMVYLSLAHIAARDKEIPIQAFQDVQERLRAVGKLGELVTADTWRIPLSSRYSKDIPSPLEYIYSQSNLIKTRLLHGETPRGFDAARVEQLFSLITEDDRRAKYSADILKWSK